MPDRAQRLKQARIAAGFTSASDAARRLGVSIPTYTSHENGGRTYSIEDATLYAKRFAVTLDWLLTGEGERSARLSASGAPVIATPIVGAISADTWMAREALDLSAGDFPQLEIAMLAGGPEDRWFAVTVGEGKAPLPGLEVGDHLICRASDSLQHNDHCVVERTGFEGQLRQLVSATCAVTNGESSFSVKSATGKGDEVLTGDFRVLGKIEILYRAL